MLEFRDIDISDKDKINNALKKSDFMGCEYSFANNMAWKRLSDSKIAFFKDFYISCAFTTEDNIPTFVFPAGEGDYRELFAELRKYSESCGCPLRLSGVTENLLALLNELFPSQFVSELDRDGSDYIYKSNDLIELTGKKYHGKRNHLSRFNKLDYFFSPITENDFDDCISFSTEAYNSKTSENTHSFIAEQYAINTYFTYFNELGLKGGIIRIDGKPAAVTIGEGLNSNTFCVHIEKGDTSYEGIYAGINNCFAKAFASDYEYINREEDLGIEGLRKSKLSYHPVFLLKKYIVTFK
ncbi:MAG: phosphatidylglycerol lysyltransferase domain-containing protein [Ruminococcus sp.]|nr:phosphatidylglycerol lysyltransferase domain-containing protein [Ruminococcus sp.]